MNKQQEIEKTLNSLSGIQRAEANPYLYGKVMARLQDKPKAAPAFFNLRWQLATLVALVALNAFTLLTYKNTQSETSSEGTFAKEYFSSNSYNY